MKLQTQSQPRIRDVAEHLSLSSCTVSKALSGQPGVNERTRQRVVRAAKELGYVLNRQAQALRQGRTRCIGLLLPTLSNPVYSERMEDIYQAAEEHGYEVMVTSAEQSAERRVRLSREMIGRRMDAVVLSGGWADLPLQSFRDAGMAMLLVNAGGMAPPGVAALTVDRAAGVQRLLEHLLKLGHRRPLLLGHWAGDSERMAGIRAALAGAGLPQEDYQAFDGRLTNKWIEGAYRLTLKAFADGRRATAVMASNDQIAIGAIAALRHLGFSVPGDVSVAGMDNIEASQFCYPALTTVSQTHLGLGRLAVEMVISILKGESPPDVQKILMPELVVRKSTGPASRLEFGASANSAVFNARQSE